MKKLKDCTKAELYKAFQNCEFLTDKLKELVHENVEDDIENKIVRLGDGIDDYDFTFARRSSVYLIHGEHKALIDSVRHHLDTFWYVAHYIEEFDEDLLECVTDEEVSETYRWYATHITSAILHQMEYRMDMVERAFKQFNSYFRTFVDEFIGRDYFNGIFVHEGKVYELHEL